jgi:nitrate/nitrite transporter NarK
MYVNSEYSGVFFSINTGFIFIDWYEFKYFMSCGTYYKMKINEKAWIFCLLYIYTFSSFLTIQFENILLKLCILAEFIRK